MHELKIEELRIGNYLKHKEKVYKVCKSNFASNKIDFSKPIPITNERLTELGFKGGLLEMSSWTFTHESGRVFKLRKGQYLDKDRNKKYMYMIDLHEYYLSSHIEFVHQLQNLFYATEGLELIIKK